MPAVTNGAELVKRLKATKTPDQRLAPARAELVRLKTERNEIANAKQVVAALERAYGPDHMTVVKAKAIMETGSWSPPPKQEVVVAVEEEFLSDAMTPVSEVEASVEASKPGRTRKVVQSKKTLMPESVGA